MTPEIAPGWISGLRRPSRVRRGGSVVGVRPAATPLAALKDQRRPASLLIVDYLEYRGNSLAHRKKCRWARN